MIRELFLTSPLEVRFWDYYILGLPLFGILNYTMIYLTINSSLLQKHT